MWKWGPFPLTANIEPLDSAWFSSMTRWPPTTGASVPLQIKPFPGRGSVFLANRMLTADRHMVSTEHAALLHSVSGRWVTSTGPGASKPQIFPVWMQKGTAWILQCELLQRLFLGIELRPWWLIAPLITTREETVNRDKDESVSGLFKEKVPSETTSDLENERYRKYIHQCNSSKLLAYLSGRFCKETRT